MSGDENDQRREPVPVAPTTDRASQVKGRSTEHGQKKTEAALGPGMAMDTADAVTDPDVRRGKVSTEHGTPGGLLGTDPEVEEEPVSSKEKER